MREFNHENDDLFEAIGLTEDETEIVKDHVLTSMKKHGERNSETIEYISNLDVDDVMKLAILKAVCDINSLSKALSGDDDSLVSKLEKLKGKLKEEIEEFSEDDF